MSTPDDPQPAEPPALHDGRNNPAPTPNPPYQATPADEER
jgi:hypothetical protein